MTYEFEELTSTASPLYLVKVIDGGKVVFSFHIACDDKTQLQNIAEETYALVQKNAAEVMVGG